MYWLLLSLLVGLGACATTPDEPEHPVTIEEKPLPDYDSWWDFSDPAATETQFRELLGTTPESNTEYRLALKTQIARTEGLQKRFDEAHKTLDEVEPHLESATDVVRIRYLLERGRVFNSSGNKAAAKPLFLEAWELGNRVAGVDGFTVDAAHMLGIVEEPKAALVWNEQAMQLAENSKDEKAQKWLGSLYNNIGWTYHDMGEFELALEHFRKGWDWRKEAGKPGPTRIAQWSVGRALRSLKRYDEALALQLDLEAQFVAAKEEDGFVSEELAECHMALGDKDAARAYFAKASPFLDKLDWVPDDRKQRARELGGLE